MPEMKISPPSRLPEGYGIPRFNQVHVLRLSDRHLTEGTLRMLREDPEGLPDCGGAVSAWAYAYAGAHRCFRNRTVCLVAFQDGADVSPLPDDLRQCVVFATSNGFDAVMFDPFDPQDCPTTKYLPTYERPND